MARLITCLLGGAAAAGGIGAVWLLALRPAVGLKPPTSPGLAILEFLVIGIIAGGLVFLQLRHAISGPAGRHKLLQTRVAEEDHLRTLTAIIDRLDHKLNNALMVIRGQAEVFLRKDPDGPNRKGLERIIEHADVISDELKALRELTQIETEPYLGDRIMLTIPETEEETPDNP